MLLTISDNSRKAIEKHLHFFRISYRKHEKMLIKMSKNTFVP